MTTPKPSAPEVTPADELLFAYDDAVGDLDNEYAEGWNAGNCRPAMHRRVRRIRALVLKRLSDYEALQRQVAELEADRDFWREHFAELQAARYRDAGMKFEQARIHAETDVRQLQIMQAGGAAIDATRGERLVPATTTEKG